jgi:hypothetical protein
MSSDWKPEETAKYAEEEFVQKGFDLPDFRWVFNSNWMDWNLRSEVGRAHVTFGLGDTKWYIFHPSKSKNDLIIQEGISSSWQQAVLDAEKILAEMEE